jgi:apolipoprotein N-acyltransferase
MQRYSFEGDPASTRFGCMLVFPAALLGTVGLADYAGPQGWRGFAEFFGWRGLCVAVALVLARLFALYRKHQRSRATVAFCIAALAIGFTIFTYFAGTPVFSQGFKDTFTGSLQWIGFTTIVLFVGFCLRVGWSRSAT